MQTVLIALIGAFAAVGGETFMRLHPGMSWPRSFLLTLPTATIINWAIWKLLKTESVMGAFIIFSFSTATLRILATLYCQDTVPGKVWVAYSLVLIASMVKLWG